MLSTEIKINGVLIGYLYLHRQPVTMEQAMEVPHEFEYQYEIYEPNTGPLITGKIKHKYDDGAWILIAKIIEKEKEKLTHGPEGRS
jgi:hypothetical protein